MDLPSDKLGKCGMIVCNTQHETGAKAQLFGEERFVVDILVNLFTVCSKLLR